MSLIVYQYTTKRTLIVIKCIDVHVTRTVKVPDPVYERLSDEARKEDVSRGAIMKMWLDKADAYDSVFFKDTLKNEPNE
ncbi:hypothetical protein OSG_eHPD7_00125 [environmental Halophage eHP-D7]|nr:hypothetical protein OSG_eHPD7_00125 [environmental Halophage eHP-D7]UXF50595.1 hypothetical protein 7778G3H09_26 [Haloquadratum phage sp.]